MNWLWFVGILTAIGTISLLLYGATQFFEHLDSEAKRKIRKDLAKQHTWSNKVNKQISSIEEKIKEKP